VGPLETIIQTTYTSVKESGKDVFQKGDLVDALLFTSLTAILIKQLQQSSELKGAHKKTVALTVGKMILNDITSEEERAKKCLLFDLIAGPMIDQIVDVAKQFIPQTQQDVNVPPKACCVIQ